MAYNLLRHQVVIVVIKILFGREPPVSLVNELVTSSASLLKMALSLFNGILWKFMP